MAGRGTDIVLGGEVVIKAGGLHVIGSERHEAQKFDNQLRGRSGRQGDPGLSQYYLSLENSLMRIFATDRLDIMMKRLGMEGDPPIENPMVSASNR